VPGAIQLGSAWPGDTLAASADLFALFTGNEVLTYPQYLDLQAQHTLVAQPGAEYDIMPASGQVNVAALPTDGRWTAEGT
jgi:hypothetical protein